MSSVFPGSPKIFIRERSIIDWGADSIADKYIGMVPWTKSERLQGATFPMCDYSVDSHILYLVYRQPKHVADHSAEFGAEFMNVQA